MITIEIIEQNLEKLTRIEAALRAKYLQKTITEQEYNQKQQRIDQERKKWEAKFDDSIVDMIITKDITGESPEEMQDPVAVAEQQRSQALPFLESDDKEPDIKFTDVKRGTLDEARALEIQFLLHEKLCKAIINSEEGRWHFSTHGENLILLQFLSALQKSDRFLEVFEKEVKRHPEDWYDVIIKGKPYNENGKEKNTCISFPKTCARILKRHCDSDPSAGSQKERKKSDASHLAGKSIVLYKVEQGEYTKAGQKDFGKGFLEFPRHVVVFLDWGEYHLKAQLTTANGEWEIVPRDRTQTYSKRLLTEFRLVIPLMIKELEKPRNKYLCHTLLTEMRKNGHRHQWETIVKSSPPHHFPRECRDLYSS
jgi:hypothetical protein